MMLYAYVLWLAALHPIGCGPDGDELHRLLLGMLPVAVGCLFLTRVSMPLEEVHRMLRWLGVPLLLLMPFALRSLWGVGGPVLIGGQGICTPLPPSLWQQAWAPLHFVAIAFLGFHLVRAISTPR
jgi:hypothetical protein